MQTGKSPGDELLEEPPVPPTGFYELIDRSMHGVYAVSAIRAAILLGVFDRPDAVIDPDRSSPALGIAPGPLRDLCESLCSIGLLSREGSGYRVDPVAATYLTAGSPYRQARYLEKQFRHITEFWLPLARLLREGPVVYNTAEFFAKESLEGMAENALTGRLQKTVAEIAAHPRFPGFRNMIDLGGGHGLYAIALCRANPALEAVVMDLPGVVSFARGYIETYRAERVRLLPGNFFTDDIGCCYDLVLSSSNPSGKSVEMIGRIAAALNPGGIFVNVQPESEVREDPFLRLERQLWTLSGTEGEPGHGGRHLRDRPFMDSGYVEALNRNGLRVTRSTEIPDEYHPGYHVRLVIAEKEG